MLSSNGALTNTFSINLCFVLFFYLFFFFFILSLSLFIKRTNIVIAISYWFLPSSIICGSMEVFCAQKIIQEKFTKLAKIFNFIKSSRIIVWSKIFKYHLYIYFFQDKSTHFGLRVLINFVSEISGDFSSQSNQTRKTDKINKIFELYQVFMYNFLPQNVLISPKSYSSNTF